MRRFLAISKKLTVVLTALSLFCGSFSVPVLADEEFPQDTPYTPEIDLPVDEPQTPDVPPIPQKPEEPPVDPCAIYGHDISSAVIVYETCTHGGTTRYFCSRCDYYEDHENEPLATDHVRDDGNIIQAATCLQDGVVLYCCRNCGADMGTETIPKLAHVSDSGAVVQEPTATATGKKVYSCVYCGTVISEEIIPCIAKRNTPSAELNTINGVLSNIPENSTVAVNSNVFAASAAGTLDLSPCFANAGQYTINIKANALDNKAESDIQTIYTSKPAAPLGVTTKPVILGQSAGSIDGVDGNMEYKLQDGDTWVTCPNGSISVPDGGLFVVRYKATSTQLASDSFGAIVGVEERVKPAKPNATFIAENHTLSNLQAGYVYSTNGGDTWTKVANGHANVQLSNDAVNQAVTYGHILIKQTVPVESDVQSIGVNRESTPSGISSTPATNGNNGSIKGVGTGMQYRIEGGRGWFDIGSNVISGLAPNNYYIRRKAHGTTVESSEVKIVVSKGEAPHTQEGKPNAVFNAYNMVIDDIAGCRLSFDCGGSWTNIIYDHRYVLSETQVNTNCGIQVYKPGNGSTTKDSEKQYIVVTKMPVPTGISAFSATANAYGMISGVDSSMQYRLTNSASWVDVPAGTNSVAVPAGTYYLRRHGYENALASDALTVVIKTQTNATPIVPSTDTKPTKEVTVDTTDKILPTKDENGKDTTDNGIIVVRDDSVDGNTETKNPEVTKEEVPATDESEALVLNVEQGWEEIEKAFETASEPVTVKINTATEIPSEVFTKAVETNTPLVLAVDQQAVWAVDPSDISVSDVSLMSAIDLGITENTSTIPTEVLGTVEDNVSDKKLDHTFDIKHEGSFGFTAYLTVKTAEDAVGKFANLYWYNTKTGKMEYVESSLVNEKAEATFKMNHASSYAVIISGSQMSAADVKDSTITVVNEAKNDTVAEPSSNVKTDNSNVTAKKKSPVVMILIVVIILALLGAVISSVIYSKKRKHL